MLITQKSAIILRRETANGTSTGATFYNIQDNQSSISSSITYSLHYYSHSPITTSSLCLFQLLLFSASKKSYNKGFSISTLHTFIAQEDDDLPYPCHLHFITMQCCCVIQLLFTSNKKKSWTEMA